MEKVVLSNLAYLRRQANLKQRDLAEQLGVERLTVAQWEQGRRCPSVLIAAKLAQLLNCKIDDLIKNLSH